MPILKNCSSILPFENLETTARDLSVNFLKFTERNLNEGWERDKFSIPSVLPPVDWSAHNRSFSYHLHAWDAIADLLMRYDRLGERPYFDASLAHARSWIEEFQLPLLGKDSAGELDALVHPKMPVEWYDMAVGLRVYRIAYILDVLLHTDGAERDVELFTEALRFHLKLLRREHFFRKHSNHGFYQALGQLAATRRFRDSPEFADDFQLAQQRFKEVLDAHFARDGAHLEHSPGYHFMILGTIMNARRSGLIEAAHVEDVVANIERAFSWMVGPDWRIATFGDTDPRGMVRQLKTAEMFRDPAARYIISGGEVGTPPPEGVQAYRDAGYAFARLYAPEVEPVLQNASYLAQTAAFHSRVHKHADHLGFVWHDRGRDILIDPGRYGYAGRTETGSDLFNQGFWYADPKRIYVESTRAHNCVEIDARSYPRRGVTPFGSALRYAGEQDGLAVTDCELTHLRSIRHRRVLVMAPGHFLLVVDWLNDRGGKHDYRQWFQFAPEWTLEPAGGGIVARAPAHGPEEAGEALERGTGLVVGKPGQEARGREALTLVNLVEDDVLGRPIRGQEEPELQGWMSDAAYSLVPSTSVAVEATGRSMARFATLLVFGDEVSVDRKTTRFNASMRAGTVSWVDQRGPQLLDIRLGGPGDVQARRSS